MSALTVCGVEVPVLADSTQERAGLGTVELAEDGTVQDTRRAKLWHYRFRTGPLSLSDSLAFRGLIEGDGHTISFDSTTTATSFRWTSRGLAPTLSGGTKTAGGKYGASLLRLTGAADEASWAVAFGSSWTVMFWFRVSDAPGIWQHGIVTSGGSGWLDGVANTLPTYIARCGATLSLGDTSDTLGMTYIDIDDVVALPFVVPTTWIASMRYFHAVQPWPSLGKVSVAGDRIPSGGVTARGEVSEVSHPDLGATLYDAFSFVLRQTP